MKDIFQQISFLKKFAYGRLSYIQEIYQSCIEGSTLGMYVTKTLRSIAMICLYTELLEARYKKGFIPISGNRSPNLTDKLAYNVLLKRLERILG